MDPDLPHGHADLFRRLVAGPGRAERLCHLEVLPARRQRSEPWPQWVAPELVAAWTARGIEAPWSHQCRTAEAAHAGRHVVLATGTASGKSLGYLMPALTAALGANADTVLYLSPTKALAQDQLATLRALDTRGLRAATHDGDSSREERDWARAHGRYLLTNPDMLHHAMLPGHARWDRFLSRLRYVVVDECHHYRGVFGAHVAQVLRRLRRVCAVHGAAPTFVLASATVAEPDVVAGRLTGLEVEAVTEDASPRGQVTLALWEPPLNPPSGQGSAGGAPVRRSATAEVADLLADLVVAGVRTLAFVRSRRGTETVALTARRLLEDLADAAPGLAARVAAYRGGYLPEERREIEQALRSGELLGLAATNALELGIDVAGLDAVLLAGFPGTRAAMWQQVGRAGRAGRDSLGVLVARDDPLDTYLVHHPEALLGEPVESTVFDPQNPYVLGPHLCAAAAESPLTEDDAGLFGPTMLTAVAALSEAGLLRRRPRGWFWTDRRRAADLADLRGAGGTPVRLVEGTTGRVLGTVDRAAAHQSAHAGAVYVHQGESWVVQSLDLDDGLAVLERGDPGYTTFAREVTDIGVVTRERTRRWGEARVSLGRVRVRSQVVSFLRRAAPSGEVLGEEPLDLPERTLETTGVWWTVPRAVVAGAGLEERDLPGAAHAAEHASIGLLPLFATCDRWDVGGVSTAAHPDTGMLTVFVHDGHPGGAGFAERGFVTAARWLRATREAIASCECPSGCPSCVQSPKCGNGNEPLDKHGAVALLDLLLDRCDEAPDAAPRVGAGASAAPLREQPR